MYQGPEHCDVIECQIINYYYSYIAKSVMKKQSFHLAS